MSLAQAATVSLVVGWKQTKTNTGFNDSKQGPQTSSLSLAPAVATYNNILLTQFTLAASATSTVDLYSFTDLLSQSVTATKLIGFAVFATATVTGGSLKIEPGATNPCTFALAGTTPSITLTVGTTGAGCALFQGTTHTLSATDRNVKFSNPGSQTITVTLHAIVGT